MSFSVLLPVFITMLLTPIDADARIDGYPIANFSVTANAGADGGMFGNTMVNPGKLGEWLESQGEFPDQFYGW